MGIFRKRTPAAVEPTYREEAGERLASAPAPVEPRYRTAVPKGVLFYESTHDYIAEVPERQSRGFDIPGELSGWDVGDRFLLTETSIPGEPESEWRISVFRDEVYAVLRRQPLADLHTFAGPVWLIDRVPDLIGSSVYDEPIRALMSAVEDLRPAPDSLLDAVRLIRTTFKVLRSLDDYLGPSELNALIDRWMNDREQPTPGVQDSRRISGL